MERYNPFSNPSALSDDQDPFKINPTPKSDITPTRDKAFDLPASPNKSKFSDHSSTSGSYSTMFPDPFNELEPEPDAFVRRANQSHNQKQHHRQLQHQQPPVPGSLQNRSKSVTIVASSSFDEPTIPASRSGRQASGLSSFLSRATSVTSSSVTDRVSGAVGSVRNAVDSISNQIQQAVPIGSLNERLISNPISNNLDGQPQQSAASYLASKLSSATGQFTSSGSSTSSLPIISRQRVILIIDATSSTNWPQQFNNYYKLTSGQTNSSQSALNFLFSSQIVSGGSSSNIFSEGSDLVEQVDFKDISVVANQSSSTATIYVSNNNSNSICSSNRNIQMVSNISYSKIIRPEYVIIRQQQTEEHKDYLMSIVKAINYCLVPMFEPIEIWHIFQDRQLIFSKLLQIQKTLGKENFPLIPQVFLLTNQDLFNYIGSSKIMIPCLARVGPLGRGKIKISTIQMLHDFASIMATSCQSCTIEKHLDVKYDLFVQKLGTNLKLFKRNLQKQEQSAIITPSQNSSTINDNHQYSSPMKQSAARQTSLGSSVLSSLVSVGQDRSPQRNVAAASNNVERLAEVSNRYKNWIEAISKEFDNKLDAFVLKIAVASDDREYIVGLNNSSMEFYGNQENQEEDRRSFVELIISKMNTSLPKKTVYKDKMDTVSNSDIKRDALECLDNDYNRHQSKRGEHTFGDKKCSSQTEIDDCSNGNISDEKSNSSSRNYNQFNSMRSKSMSVNDQTTSPIDRQTPANRSIFLGRRSSDRTDSLTNELEDLSSELGSQNVSNSDSFHQRQSSLGQSFLDQTSTAFSSFHKQSLSFFKRFDTRGSDIISSTPPISAKSDKAFDKGFMSHGSIGGEIGTRNGFKSQSVDGSSFESHQPLRTVKRELPPKPPPPQFGNRQSSLASYSSQRVTNATSSPNTTPIQTRQNSANSDGGNEANVNQRTKVVRQNSALSAFEPFDPDLAILLREKSHLNSLDRQDSSKRGDNDAVEKPLPSSIEVTKKSSNFDAGSITSGDSNSTAETNTAEDTMNNLKKTFASIFGDKCE